MEEFWADPKLNTCKSCGTPNGKPTPVKRIIFEPKIVIERFDFTNASMTLKTPVAKDRSQKLGDVHLTGIGEGSGGATAAQAASQILAPILREAVKQARSGAGELGVEGYKQGAMDKLKDKLGIGN